jgi:hypothetical protein
MATVVAMAGAMKCDGFAKLSTGGRHAWNYVAGRQAMHDPGAGTAMPRDGRRCGAYREAISDHPL